VIIAIAAVSFILVIWKWPMTETVQPPKTTVAPIDPKAVVPGQPRLLDPRSGTYIIPLYVKNRCINLAWYHRATGAQRVLLKGSASISDIAIRTVYNDPTVLLTMATEDTNSDGKIDRLDIHQLYWCSASGTLKKVNKPIFNFVKLLSALPNGSGPTGNTWGNELVYKVTVDTNHNGQTDGADPVQFVLVDLEQRTLRDMLPDSIVPTAAISTENTTN